MKTMLKFSLLAATAIVANPAIAQDQADAGYNEASDAKIIIVTARKKEETLLDAPLAVSVVGEDELEQGGFTDITEITKVTPGAFVEAGGQNTNGFARINSTPRFRGISVLSGNPLQQTASVFLDGIYLSGGIETIGINELQRVEVIKGPQSALFGRNTFAGAINYVTKDPSNELRADLSATIATRNEYGVSGGVEGPLFDGVSFRVGGSFSDKQGHYDNVAVPGQRLGDEQQWSINGTLLIEPSDGFRLKLRGSYQEINDGPSAAVASFGTAFHNFGGFLLNPDGTVNLNDGVQPAPRNGTRTESVYRGQIRRPSAAEIGLNTSSADVQAFRGFLNDGRSDPSDAIFGFKYNPTTVNDFGLNLDALRLSAVGSIDLTDNIQFSFLGGYNKENFGFFADFDTSPDVSFTGFTARETEDYTIEGRLSGSFLDDSLNVSAGASYVKIDIAELGGGTYSAPHHSLPARKPSVFSDRSTMSLTTSSRSRWKAAIRKMKSAQGMSTPGWRRQSLPPRSPPSCRALHCAISPVTIRPCTRLIAGAIFPAASIRKLRSWTPPSAPNWLQKHRKQNPFSVKKS